MEHEEPSSEPLLPSPQSYYGSTGSTPADSCNDDNSSTLRRPLAKVRLALLTMGLCVLAATMLAFPLSNVSSQSENAALSALLPYCE